MLIVKEKVALLQYRDALEVPFKYTCYLPNILNVGCVDV